MVLTATHFQIWKKKSIGHPNHNNMNSDWIFFLCHPKWTTLSCKLVSQWVYSRQKLCAPGYVARWRRPVHCARHDDTWQLASELPNNWTAELFHHQIIWYPIVIVLSPTYLMHLFSWLCLNTAFCLMPDASCAWWTSHAIKIRNEMKSSDAAKFCAMNTQK